MAEFTKMDLHALQQIWKSIEKDNTFGSFEAFVVWSRGRRKPGFAVYKIDSSKPYNQDNAYWYYRTKELSTVESPFCAGCPRAMTICNTDGCLEYRERFVKTGMRIFAEIRRKCHRNQRNEKYSGMSIRIW